MRSGENNKKTRTKILMNGSKISTTIGLSAKSQGITISLQVPFQTFRTKINLIFIYKNDFLVVNTQV